MIKCKCGHEWTDKEILKGYETDELGKYYNCYRTKELCRYSYYISPFNIAFTMYKALRKRHKEILLEQLQKKHKYTMEEFVKR